MAEKKPFIQIVIGPRQVGKTTALKAALSGDAIYYSADYPTPLSVELIDEWWQQARHTKSRILAIDEIQKIPNWTEMIKCLWDLNTHELKVVLTGSSALLLEKGLRESLAGRFELIRAEHWNYHEARDIFSITIEQYIEFGCYPGSMPLLMQDHARWAEYIRDAIIEPAIGRDLLQLHPVKQPALLRQVFGMALSLPAQIVSLQKLQGQLQYKGVLSTIQHYLSLLADAFLVSGIEKYSPYMMRSKKSSPKLIVHDNSFMKSFQRSIEMPIHADERGRYFENSIGARFIEVGWDTYYWKNRQLEVDYVVIGPNNEHWAVEVKTTATHRSQLDGLFKFCEQYPNFEPVLVSLVDQQVDDVRTISGSDILSLHRQYG